MNINPDLLSEKTISSEYVFRGRIINLRVDQAEMPDGKTAGREVIEHNGGVCVVALTDRKSVV